MELHAKIEALLFFKGEPVTIKKIAEILGVSEGAIHEAILVLKQRQVGSGLSITENGNEVMLGTNRDASGFLEAMRKDEISRDLTKSSLETLSIILYNKGATRAEIDYIRGVNSSFILRNLLIRGLIEKNIDPNDSRRYTYSPTTETLQYMGITTLSELPDFDSIVNNLKNALKGEENVNHE
ncbi:SMC-Scp complex subunit ScpB [Candidatus Nomurabacteria bacterium]|nr:SMC-Scp complex subunit ScpB [Candidatus Nomurabacteria bacterium]